VSTHQDVPSEDEMRAAYEAELNRMTSADMMLQAAVSLLNIGGRRLGLAGGPEGPAPEAERDLEQVRDAIDGVRGLLGVLERRLPQELGPLRDALSQLQMAYARAAQAGESDGNESAPQSAVGEDNPRSAAGESDPRSAAGESASRSAAGESAQPDKEQVRPAGEQRPSKPAEDAGQPGPAESSGRLWVPGR
jgi:hypothetical protein